MAGNDWFCQFLADIIAAPVERPAMLEATANGAAFLAGLKAGVWPDLDSLRRLSQEEHEFRPKMTTPERERRLKEWRRAVQAVIAFYT